MALIGSHSFINKTPGRFISGASYAQSKGNFYHSGAFRNQDAVFGHYSANPQGYGAGYAYKLPAMAGMISSYTNSFSSFTTVFNFAGGRNLEASETGTLTTNNPVLDRIVSMIMSATSVVITSAELSAALQLIASSSASISYDALLGAIFSVTVNANGSASGSPFLTALANIGAEAGGPTPLSPEGLAYAVWSSILEDNKAAGTVGEAIANTNTEIVKKLDKSLFIALK